MSDTQLDDLRAHARSENTPEARELYAKALFNAHYGARSTNDTATANTLLDELRELKDAYDEPAVRKRLAMALANAHADAIKTTATATANTLLDELCALKGSYDEPAVREQLAKALVNAHYDAGNINDTTTANTLLNELRALKGSYDEPAVREQLAMALANAHCDAGNINDTTTAETLLDELRALKGSYDEPAVREQLAKALANAHYDAGSINDTTTADTLLKELRKLAGDHDEPGINAVLYWALNNARMHAIKHSQEQRARELTKDADDILEKLTPKELQKLSTREQNRFKLLKVVRKFSPAKEKFTRVMEARKRRSENFLADKSYFCTDVSLLFVLRQWNSYTPIIVDDEESDRGGGYFIYHKRSQPSESIGLIIDPGYNFIEHFHAACCRVHDITHIAITHAHDDHTAQLEQLFTLLHQYNTRRKEKEKPVKKITLLLNHSVCKKFCGFDMHKGAEYIKRVIALNAFDAKSIQKIQLGHDFFLTVLPAYHNDVFSSDYAVGLGLTIGTPAKHLLFTSDTGLYPPLLDKDGKAVKFENETYKGEAKVNEKDGNEIHRQYPGPFKTGPDLLVPHIGSIKPYEFEAPINTDSPMFYPNHLGLLGTALLIKEVKPKAVVVSEFGAELQDIRGYIAHMLRETIAGDADNPAPCIFPGDTSIVYNISEGTFLCHEDGKYHAPENLVFKDLGKNGIGLFHDEHALITLEPFRAAQNKARQGTNNAAVSFPLPYLCEEQE